MFIINLNYKVSLDLVDKYLDKHVAYLNEQYANGKFHISGRKIPKVGGVIISNIADKTELLEIIEKDPFKIYDVAAYEIIEFKLSKVSHEFKFLTEEVLDKTVKEEK